MQRQALCAVVLGTVLLLGGCAAPRPPVVLSEVEHRLLEQLTRDPFIRVDAITREADGFVTIHTVQGNTTAWYRLMPTEGSEVITLRRIDDRQALPVAWSDDLGTGPQHRGLTHTFTAR